MLVAHDCSTLSVSQLRQTNDAGMRMRRQKMYARQWREWRSCFCRTVAKWKMSLMSKVNLRTVKVGRTASLKSSRKLKSALHTTCIRW